MAGKVRWVVDRNMLRWSISQPSVRFHAQTASQRKGINFKDFKDLFLSQGQNLAVTVLHVPHSLDSVRVWSANEKYCGNTCRKKLLGKTATVATGACDGSSWFELMV